MKRLYTLMLSAVMAAAASAAIPVSKAPANLAHTAATEVTSPLPGGLHVRIAEPQMEMNLAKQTKTRTELARIEGGKLQRKSKAPRKADGTGSKFDGTYTMVAGEWYLKSQAKASVPVEVEMVVNNGIATISNDNYLTSDVLAKLDEETGVMTFVNYFVGTTSEHAISFMPFVYEDGINFTSYSITYDEETESFDIPADHGISWPAWTVENIDSAKAFDTSNFIGYYDIFDLERLSKSSGEEETWKSLGQGEWYEGLLTVFSAVESGLHWPVEIEESESRPGVYRMKPYAVEGNPIAAIVGRVDNETVVTINATDPTKVYTAGRFSPFGLTTFSGINSENNFNGSSYGTMVDGVISFPAKSFAYSSESGWYYVNDENFKILLPGATLKDYTLKATTASICAAGATNVVNLTLGADIAGLKVMFLKGKYDTAAGTNAQIVAKNGNAIKLGDSFTVNTPEEGGIYSILIVALNSNGDVVANATCYQIVDAEKDEDWEVVSNVKATYTEGFLCSLFSDVNPEQFNVVLEENVNTPGRLRFEAPYAQHSMANAFSVPTDHNHKHYIYVNATNPEKAYVEISALGVNLKNFGSFYGYSLPGLYANTSDFDNIEDKYFGSFADGKITTPAFVSTNNLPNIGNYNAEFTLTIDTITANGDWKSIGKGHWVEGFFTDYTYGWVTENVDNVWEVEIEESTETAGIYRVLPYGDGSIMAGEDYLGEADNENYFIVNATNPDSVYVVGHYTPYGELDFYQNCPEATEDFDADYYDPQYGKFIDGEIFFPIGSFTEIYDGYEYIANADGILMLVMPGVEVKDYQLVATTDLCSDNGKATIKLPTIGTGIAKARTTTVAGHMFEAYMIEGTPVEVDLTAETINHSVANPVGGNTTLVEAIDANGNVRRQQVIYHFNNYDFMGWHNVEGKEAKFIDEALYPFFELEDSQEITCGIQEKDDTPGMYRVVNPYRSHAATLGHEMWHNHYLYIDATDPDFVMLVPSTTGLGTEEVGEFYLTNAGCYYNQLYGKEFAKYKGAGGTMNDGVIEIPDVLAASTNYFGGAWMNCGAITVELVSDGKDGISEISSDSEAEAVYHNLRGQRVTRPTAPGFYIRNNTKVYVK